VSTTRTEINPGNPTRSELCARGVGALTVAPAAPVGPPDTILSYASNFNEICMALPLLFKSVMERHGSGNSTDGLDDSPASADGVEPPAPIRGLRVLVVGGGGHAARDLEATLKALGLEPQIAATGGKALLDLRRASDDDDAFAAVLIHERLPDRRGSDLVIDIRREPRLGAPALVLIAEEGDEPRPARGAGGIAQLRRPFQANDLLAALAAGLSRTPTVPVAFEGGVADRLSGRST
jgi:CheY-like chemotaxis protein